MPSSVLRSIHASQAWDRTAQRFHSQSFHLTEPRVWRGSVQGVRLASCSTGARSRPRICYTRARSSKSPNSVQTCNRARSARLSCGREPGSNSAYRIPEQGQPEWSISLSLFWHPDRYARIAFRRAPEPGRDHIAFLQLNHRRGMADCKRGTIEDVFALLRSAAHHCQADSQKHDDNAEETGHCPFQQLDSWCLTHAAISPVTPNPSPLGITHGLNFSPPC